jgi:hypothetical protein
VIGRGLFVVALFHGTARAPGDCQRAAMLTLT